MTMVPYILDTPLSPEQDFRALKQRGLDYVRDHSSMAWSNLNDSDPGITIMDQVCFALSELGYCTNFSINDLLTGPDGQLKIRNQFYLPEEILSTSPVTVNDYKKLILDRNPEVVHAAIHPVAGCRCYNVFLQFRQDMQHKKIMTTVCKRVFFLLNRQRSLGELFLMPQPFKKRMVLLCGNLVLQNDRNIAVSILELQKLLNDYISPPVTATGFDQLCGMGLVTEEIVNGPLLKNGWIPDTAISLKKDAVTVHELNYITGQASFITTAAFTGLQLTGGQPVQEINVAQNRLISFDLYKSVQNNCLTIIAGNRKLAIEEISAALQEDGHLHTEQEYLIHPLITHEKINPPAPGKYRNISNYYSIQNTFPEIYASGPNPIHSNAPDNLVARSRQLKGYLTLFDQVMANQFAQLDNIDRLFSFSNTSTADPADTNVFYAEKDRSRNNYGIYPVPYKYFSPTYFYQSLYNVPDIKHLLKDNNLFAYNTRPVSPKELEIKSWEEYKADPYNPYIKGLMDCMEDDETNLQRRNGMLNHLLARYGESPLLIDIVTDGSIRTGNKLKDNVIIKSLLLQNLSSLSFNRARGTDYYTTAGISETLPALPGKADECWPEIYSSDSVTDMDKIEAEEKITDHDFNNFSATELKFSLLFAIKPLYKNYIRIGLADNDDKTAAAAAQWLISERRGLILVENCVLRHTKASMPEMYRNDRKSDDSGTGITLLLPGFIPELNTPAFRERLQLYLDNTLPVSVPYRCFFISGEMMVRVIPAFARWFNSLKYIKGKTARVKGTKEKATEFSNLLKEIIAENNE